MQQAVVCHLSHLILGANFGVLVDTTHRHRQHVNHAVAVDGDVLGWAVEHRSTDGETIGWGVWGDRGPDGLLASRDEAAQWIAEHL